MEKLHIPQNLYKQYLLGKFCDLQIQVESSYFRAHSCVVAASSSVLEAILQASTTEDENLSKPSIQLHGVTADAISSLLNFIYTGEFATETYSDVVKRNDVLHAAKLYKMAEVPMEFETSSKARENGAMTNMEMFESGNFNDDLLEDLEPSQYEEVVEAIGSDTENVILMEEQSDSESNQAVSESEKLNDDAIEEYVLKNVNYAISHGILYCVLCSKIFPKQADLISHMNEHKPDYKPNRKRPECAAASLPSSALDNDGSLGEFGNDYEVIDYYSSKKKHRPKREFTCGECGASYSGKLHLIKHYNTRHPGSLYCKYCAESLQTETLMRIHMLTHGPDIEEQYKSTSGTKCKRTTKTKTEIGYTCNLCSTSFLKRKELVQHHQIIHGIIKPMHVCPKCGKDFKDKSRLRTHTRVHTGEKPFTCTYCENSFADRKTLKDHERRHRGEKPFVCTACGKSFTYRQSFTRHMKFHEGKKPFQCSFCGKSFVLRQNLKVHEKRHNK